MSTATVIKPIHDALDGLRFAMVTTTASDAPSTRPLTMLEEDEGVLRFFVPKDADWVRALPAQGGHATVSFSEPRSNNYVAIEGTASTTDDQSLIERLWTPAAKPYFEGTDDPNLAVLEVVAESGEYWDGPDTKVGTAIAMVTAALTGDEHLTGEHGPVTT